MKFETTRRALLAGSTALGLVSSLRRSALASDAGAPLRFLLVFTPGTTTRQGWTEGTGESFTVGRTLASLEPFRDRLLIPRGLDTDWTRNESNPHINSICAALTATDPDDAGRWPTGYSIDQFLAARMDATTPFESLRYRAGPPAQLGRLELAQHAISYGPDGEPRDGITNPTEAFELTFGSGVDESQAELQRRLAVRASVLDGLVPELRRIRRELSGDAAVRFERHADAIRAIESNLGESGGCTPPSFDDALDSARIDDYPSIVRSYCDMAAAALACDITRVAAITIEDAGAANMFDFLGLGLEGIWHDHVGHLASGSASAMAQLGDINAWFGQQVGYLVERLDAYGVLDDTVVLWTTDIDPGLDAHGKRDVPHLIVGDAHGYFRTGQVVDAGGVANQLLLTSLCHAFGHEDVEVFGKPGISSGPLPGLT